MGAQRSRRIGSDLSTRVFVRREVGIHGAELHCGAGVVDAKRGLPPIAGPS
jgi:hypothetical protein